jgi:RNA polymerase sigma-70 factor (ECF subfamily)
VVDDPSGDLLARWRRGDQGAADALFQRYAGQLIALAARRLGARLAQRIDAEDVVQSVYRSFFASASAGRYDLQRGGDLWRLLVVITLQKLRAQVEHHTAQKRSVRREKSLSGDDGPSIEAATREPSPLEALALADEVERLMRTLEPLDRQVLELRLQGYNLEEIAAATRRSERTVTRTLRAIKQQLEQWQPCADK